MSKNIPTLGIHKDKKKTVFFNLFFQIENIFLFVMNWNLQGAQTCAVIGCNRFFASERRLTQN